MSENANTTRTPSKPDDPMRSFSEDTDMKRDLGLLEAVSIVVNRIIGSGIFRTPAPIMAYVASTSLFGLVWALGGIVTIFGAVIYAELAAMMPRSGGPYEYLKMSYGPFWAFLRGWAMFFVSETASITAVALIFAEYLSAAWFLVNGVHLDKMVIFAVAFATIWLLTMINLWGVQFSGWVQNIFSFVKIAAVGSIIGIAFTSWSTGNWANFITPLFPESFGGTTILAVGAALRYAFFAFSGWEGATYIAEEVKNPRRNLPLSLFIGIGGVMLLYLGANAAYLFQLPPERIAEAPWVATEVMTVAMGATGGILISIAVMINTFGNVNTQILCKARTWQAMARDGVFFDWFAKLHPTYRTPNNALLGQAGWATVLLVFAVLADNSYETMIDFFSATSTIFNILVFTSIWVLRRKYPDAHRPYRAWLYPWSLVGILAIYFAFLVITLITAFVPSIIGLGLTATGAVYYFFKVGFGRRPVGASAD